MTWEHTTSNPVVRIIDCVLRVLYCIIQVRLVVLLQYVLGCRLLLLADEVIEMHVLPVDRKRILQCPTFTQLMSTSSQRCIFFTSFQAAAKQVKEEKA